jgi:CHAT domain-containing protein
MDEAFDEALRSGEIAHDHIRLMASSLSERGTLAYAATKSNSFDICLSLAASHEEGIGKFVSKAWDYLIRSRALVFDEMSARHRTTLETSDPETKALADSFFSARRSLANLVVRGPGAINPGESYRGLLDKVSERKEQAERELAQASIAFRKGLERSRAGLDVIKSSLPPGFSLVAFARYNHYMPSAHPSNELRQIPSYVAFVLQNPTSEPIIIPLGTEEAIEPLVFDWGQEAARGTRIPGRSVKDSEGAYSEAGEALRQKVWDPVSAHLGETKCVLVVPDGVLHTVNFASLPIEHGKYLIENGSLIHYLSAERDLMSTVETSIEGTGLLALGDPAFDDTTLFSALTPEKKPKQSILSKAKSFLPFRGTRSGCGDFRSMRFTALPAAHKEIQNVTDIWASSEENNGDVLKLTGDMASEEAFKIAAPGKQILHLATHGFFIEGDCPSALKREDKHRESGQDAIGITPVIGENPLLLSGLALAGANNREAAGPDEEDGILTAEEVAALDLSGSEWVVLSACDTGVGKIKAGEGIFGLRRAFRQAGAQTLITSLWSVEDQAAQKWMRALYKARFEEGLGTAESVCMAYLEVLQELRKRRHSTHPFYWAGFVASGDWRQ